MTAALGLPLALALGIVADAVAGLSARLAGGERRWWRGITDRWGELRRLMGAGRAGERASVLEALAAGGSMLGAGIASAAAVGTVPGTLALIYLGLLAAAAGGHLLEAAIGKGDEEGPGAAASRLRAVLVEPAFVVALGASFLRWGAVDLDSVRGTQEVLGPGIGLGPGSALAGLVLGTLVLAVAGALRTALAPSGGPAGRAFLAATARWAAWGATAAVAGALLGGPGTGSATDILVMLGTATGAAVVLGVVAGLTERASRRVRRIGLVGLVLAAAGGALLVALA